MPSKLSVHIREYPEDIWDAMGRMQPRVVKVFDHTSEMNIDTLKRVAKPLVIFRQSTPHNDFETSSADSFVAELTQTDALQKLAGRGILWEGINEPGIGHEGMPKDVERAKALNRWYVRFAELMHARGEKVAGFSWSTGNPTDEHLRWIIPHITEAAAAVDAHAFHEYTKPRFDNPRSDWRRYRLFEQALPSHARKPVVITETGVDERGDPATSGWAAQMTAAEYLRWLAEYDDCINADPYVLGATIYTLKDPLWPSFEIAGEALGRLAEYAAGKGGGTVLGEAWPVPDFVARSRGEEIETSYSFVVKPRRTKQGKAATLRWQVTGASGVYLNGQEVTPDGERVVVPQRTTGYRLHIEFPDLSYKDLDVVAAVDARVTRAAGPVPSRPASVVLDAANLERLKHYPRPPKDNGIGLHFHLDLRDDIIRDTVDHLTSIRATWTLIYAQDELQAEKAATACFRAGIMPVVRPGRLVDEGFDPKPYVEALRKALAASDFPHDEKNPPLYVQIYNEPEDEREWSNERPKNWAGIFGRNWANVAVQVYDAGGYPGIQVLDRPGFDAAVDSVAALGRQDIWQRAFFAHHNYGSNHPADYPYDERNQLDAPGQTILGDYTAVLKFLAHAAWMKERLGFVLPLIGGEGGWLFGCEEDHRYPKVETELHAQYTQEMFERLRTGVLSNGEPLPDYLFSIKPWIAGSWTYGGQNWWGNFLRPDGKLTQTIEAVQAIPPFVRRFSWGEPEEPKPKPKPKPQPHPEPQPAPLDWDPRLDELGVQLTRAADPVTWRLISARFQDESESGGRHHVFIRAESVDGSPAAGVRFVVDWLGRLPQEMPGFTTTDAQGAGNVPIFITLHPDKKDGIQFAKAADEPSDVVTGMGLPYNHHVSFALTYRRQ
jgi:hypothetical protein